MYADCHGWKYVNIDMILLLVVSFSINLESYVLMTCEVRKFDNFSYAFNIYTRLSISVICHKYVSVLIICWRQILFVHPVYYFGWARYRAARAYHVAQLQKICFICEWRVLNYFVYLLKVHCVTSVKSTLCNLSIG
jgi:hypothetical protein